MLPISLDKLLSAQLILIIFNEDRGEGRTLDLDFNCNPAIIATLIGKYALERVRLFKDLLLVPLLIKVKYQSVLWKRLYDCVPMWPCNIAKIASHYENTPSPWVHEPRTAKSIIRHNRRTQHSNITLHINLFYQGLSCASTTSRISINTKKDHRRSLQEIEDAQADLDLRCQHTPWMHKITSGNRFLVDYHLGTDDKSDYWKN